MDYIRDYAMYTAIFGIFSCSWFGWALENPRPSWRLYLGIASGISLLVGLFGIYLSITHWDAGTALSEPGAYDHYLLFVFIEFFLAGIGAFWLLKNKRSNVVAPWIAFIVGVHFFWLKSVFQDAGLYLLAVLLIAVSVISLFVSKKLNVASSAITGIGAGTVLLCFAVLGWIRFVTA
ncbi:hypothetical protein ACFQI7_07605 [Paenibacillus allorhizosphaerae]|uniref:Uncharacterized protein n=1 Tax=Paenibacillus allorhizosphaerae TaxID=2849866 RepID=A0ABM8VG50_9BACL|nr:hypothetical protein [Paenibacillus allorhizosphaerae]CAG7637262.1 hypothetical protein PAECIP111802_02339 [Paenibacillus allorhizosphaerae]